jgi:hypothetical protein
LGIFILLVSRKAVFFKNCHQYFFAIPSLLLLNFNSNKKKEESPAFSLFFLKIYRFFVFSK